MEEQPIISISTAGDLPWRDPVVCGFPYSRGRPSSSIVVVGCVCAMCVVVAVILNSGCESSCVWVVRLLREKAPPALCPRSLLRLGFKCRDLGEGAQYNIPIYFIILL